MIPSQDTYLGCRFRPWSGCGHQATDRCFSPSLSPSLVVESNVGPLFSKQTLLADISALMSQCHPLEEP